MSSPLRIASIYIIFGVIWILGTDYILNVNFDSSQGATRFQSIKGITFVVLSGIVVFLASYFDGKRKEALEKRVLEEKKRAREVAIEAEERERNRIGLDLHDGIQQRLAGISLMLESFEAESLKGSKEKLSLVKNEVQESIEEVREIAHNMISSRLEKKGIIHAMNQLKERVDSQYPIEFDFHFHNVREEKLGYVTQVNLYRITQELINNAIKHSSADKLKLEVIQRKAGPLIYRFKDNATEVDNPIEVLSSQAKGTSTLFKRLDSIQGDLIPSTYGEREFSFSFSLDPKPISGPDASEKDWKKS